MVSYFIYGILTEEKYAKAKPWTCMIYSLAKDADSKMLIGKKSIYFTRNHHLSVNFCREIQRFLERFPLLLINEIQFVEIKCEDIEVISSKYFMCGIWRFRGLNNFIFIVGRGIPSSCVSEPMGNNRFPSTNWLHLNHNNCKLYCGVGAHWSCSIPIWIRYCEREQIHWLQMEIQFAARFQRTNEWIVR